ncbi:N-terminal domain of Peptidase_S41 [Dyadobacter soli]|uniref:N-terminal domain of Peptidase_S41 n=1 Tax=Dyadobacter soli TaxID=659014 RepID=A0A1G7SM41_9BACT|nr:S41 family peptidase [Dyadobacter soli]SDG23924.1 N-terminal domain of Peptidase_S41 [Dyadobacter soli]
MSLIQLTRFCLSATILLVCCRCALAQALPAREIDAAIAAMAHTVDTAYVFPEKGKKIAEHLRSEHRQGKFAAAKNWQDLAGIISKSLLEFSHDGHLYVRNDPKTVRDLQKPAQPGADTAVQAYNPFFDGKDAAERNFGFRDVKILNGNIGYLDVSEINISARSLPVLFAAMRFVANTRALVIDLRSNGGGGSNVGSVLESFFLPPNTTLLEFKTRNGNVQTEKTVGWLLEPRYEKPLVILVGKGTASAAEAFAYALQKHRRAKIIGQRSGGAAFMNSWYPVNEHLYISVSTGAPTWPGTTENWEATGIQPDRTVAEGTELAAVADVLAEAAK